ncbi:hypothetical protein FPHYL_9952 [Fusarium phyllophilum]|uniref:Uncharacterized protein n=1 Tax=Fusarium phyllophilum TaxID=47803 RepID=A0A8H5J524_9HYPO|nr:hypothetical protein FPHYL_9952 [Fusarium phyllophilum]
MSFRHTDQQQAGTSRERVPDTSPSDADRRKLQDLELALAKAKRELEVFCIETNQTSSLLAVEANPGDSAQEHPVPKYDPDNCCQECGSSYEYPATERKHQRTIPKGVSCVATSIMNAAGELQTRYTNTTLGASNDGEWWTVSPEGGYMGAQINGSIELLADRVREEWGCERVFYKVFADCPEQFNRVLMNHTQMRQFASHGHDLATGEPAL